MRSTVATFFACALLSGCASTRAADHPSPQEPPTANVSARAEEAVGDIPKAVPITRRPPIFGATCPLVFPSRDVGTVVRIPASMMSKAMDPVMDALCACTKPGEYSAIVAQIDFGHGNVQIRAPESSTIHECLETLHVTFEPIPDSDLPSSDCINCGPRYYGVFADSPPPPPKEAGLRLMYSFLLDRSSEVLDCSGDTHAERGACRPNVAPAPPTPDKRSCGCDATDLECSIACAATR